MNVSSIGQASNKRKATLGFHHSHLEGILTSSSPPQVVRSHSHNRVKDSLVGKSIWTQTSRRGAWLSSHSHPKHPIHHSCFQHCGSSLTKTWLLCAFLWLLSTAQDLPQLHSGSLHSACNTTVQFIPLSFSSGTSHVQWPVFSLLTPTVLMVPLLPPSPETPFAQPVWHSHFVPTWHLIINGLILNNMVATCLLSPWTKKMT